MTHSPLFILRLLTKVCYIPKHSYLKHCPFNNLLAHYLFFLDGSNSLILGDKVLPILNLVILNDKPKL